MCVPPVVGQAALVEMQCPADASSCLQNAVALAVAAAEEALKAAEATSMAEMKHDSARAQQGDVEAMEVDEGNSAGECLGSSRFESIWHAPLQQLCLPVPLHPSPRPSYLSASTRQLGADLQHGLL